MPTRRSFLRGTLLFSTLLCAAAFARDDTSVSFADFESGDWNDWTVEGDAFGVAPATDATFAGKIHGFSGHGFVCTLHPRLGNAATGRALSQEFTIEKPFMLFKIGGGSYPNQACLNLLVEGQPVCSATGRGTPDLNEVRWDVSAYLGKKARLQIVDSTRSQNRGYVLVDAIRFAGADSMSESTVLEVPLRVIHMVDNQGKALTLGDVTTVLTPSLVAAQVRAVNRFYRSTGIVFTFDPADFEVRRNEYLTVNFDLPPAGTDLSNRAVKPPYLGRDARTAELRKIGQERRDRLTLIVHRGSEWYWSSQKQRWSYEQGPSRGGALRSAYPARVTRVTGVGPQVWAHELGHTLGLPHISRDDVTAPSSINSVEGIRDACQQYLDKGGDPNHPEYAIDGDYAAGVSDTPPDPGINFWRTLGTRTARVTLNLAGREPLTLNLSHDNIMSSDTNGGTRFTSGQVAVMRRTVEAWKQQRSEPART